MPQLNCIRFGCLTLDICKREHNQLNSRQMELFYQHIPPETIVVHLYPTNIQKIDLAEVVQLNSAVYQIGNTKSSLKEINFLKNEHHCMHWVKI